MVLDLMHLPLHRAKWQEWEKSGVHAAHVGLVPMALASPSSLEDGTHRYLVNGPDVGGEERVWSRMMFRLGHQGRV